MVGQEASRERGCVAGATTKLLSKWAGVHEKLMGKVSVLYSEQKMERRENCCAK